ncbi:fibronectin type III domain-containing protein [Lewinella cohaerens]|uniref:fibronectin type III domain-containing protein n=1 Tax=Lewinella cohaerens TaxID=70995 RepID=UPI00037C03E0|nr:fibronectin type III domain-containing protein [Lewinella cohaerens]
MRKLILVLIILSSLISLTLIGQTAYPVTAAIQSMPPFSPSLSDWADPMNNRLGMTILLNDREEPGYQVRLRFKITGPGIEMRTNSNWIPSPIAISYGQVVQLTAADLRDYFELDHLDFLGYSREAYLLNGGLPEGTYSICVEVMDYDRFNEDPASLEACTFVQARLLDPPVVLTPVGYQTPISPQSMLVQWQARHTATFITNYRVEIYQLDPSSNLTPEQVYSLQQPFIETEIDGITTALLDNSFPQLETGFDYLLRVQARDLDGVFRFKNGGYSAPVIFTYGSTCVPPTGLSASVDGPHQATINWDYMTGSASYVLRFREANPNANWYEEAAVFNSATLSDLQDSTTYEVQLQSVCDGTPGAFGEIYEFTTEALQFDPEDVECTVSLDELPRPTNIEPTPTLGYGSQVSVGGFTMKVTSSGPGTDETAWNGTGQINIPWLGMRVNCRFRNLYVNTDLEVYDGIVIAVSDGLSTLDGFQSVEEIQGDLLSSDGLNFCGDMVDPVDQGETDFAGDFYASGNAVYYDQYIPFDPTRPNITVNDDMFYNEYNPKNHQYPYSPTDYSSSRNPYTAENPFDGTNTWNPWNYFNPYDPTDYDDPVNPWTPDFSWTPARMFAKQSVAGSADNSALWAGAVKLPIALGVAPNIMALTSMKFSATGAYLDAYFAGNIPIANKYMAFKAIGVGISPQGLQGEAKMKMLSDIVFTWGEKVQLTFQGGNQTYIKFDCQGINEVSIKMEAKLCHDIAFPVDEYTYERDSSAYVTSTTRMVSGGWGDFAGVIDFSPFEVSYLEGWAFTVQGAVFDFSEAVTPGPVVFPTGYTHPDVDGSEREGRFYPEWRGFFLETARVRVPDHLTGQDPENSVTVGAHHLIIDQTGFSGDIFATNVLSLDTGRLDTWALAIDSIAIGAQSSQFHHVTINGKVKVPVVDQPLGYGCHIQPAGRYQFAISLTDTVAVTMSAFVAKAELHPNTTIGVNYRRSDNNFSAYAILHGNITFKPQLGVPDGNDQGTAPPDTTNTLNIPTIGFSGFHVTTRAPYVEAVGSWDLSTNGDQATAASFPITLNEVGMFQNEAQDEIAFGLGLTLNLTNSNDQGFGAEGRGFIICGLEIGDNGQQNWYFKRVRLDKLSIDYEGPGFAFKGYLENFDTHPLYGSGFQGGIQATFTPGIMIGVAALFGKVDGYRYFFADALIGLDAGIPLGPSGIALYGFGGGISYRMERQGFSGINLPYSEAQEVSEEVPEEVEMMDPPNSLEEAYLGQQDPANQSPPMVALPSELGQSLSGVRYIPNDEYGIGIKAMVAFGAVKREVFNGDITFEIIFNANGGLSHVGFMGNANFMTPPRTPLNPTPRPSVAFYVDLTYSVEIRTFHAYMRLQVAAPPGVGLIRGSYANYVAGEGVIHADPDDWYVYLGEPTRPISLSVDFSSLKNLKKDDGTEPSLPNDPQEPLDENSINEPLGSLGDIGLILTAYLNAGTQLPAFPDPPAILGEILDLGDMNFNPTSRDHPSFANAEGVLLGAGLQLNMPELRFLIFYASLHAGAGFDLMLKNYGIDARCASNLGDPNPIGFNGWYGTGQLYAYVQGAIGIKINLGFLKVNTQILELGAAALLQGRLPNPIWAQGIVGGYFSVMRGLIKGQCQFDFEIGEECVIVPTGDEELNVIQAVVPTEEHDPPTVFTRPQAFFVIPVDVPTPFLDEEDVYVEVLPQLDYFRVVNTATGIPVAGELQWGEENKILAFRPDDALLGEQEYQATAHLKVYQRRFGEDDFELVQAGIDSEPYQRKSTTFTTQPAPPYIVEDNVLYAYPINRQTNFFRNEFGQGYIQLDVGQDYLFESSGDSIYHQASADWLQKIRFWQNGTIVSIADYTYDTGNNQVMFDIPSNELAPNTMTYLELVDIPANGDVAVDANVEDILVQLQAGGIPDGNDTEVLLEAQEADGTLEALQPKQIYRLDFRTSQYDRFADKVAALSLDFPFISIQALTPMVDENDNPIPYLSIDDFGDVVSPTEGFDRFDLEGYDEGNKEIDPLLRSEANLAFTGQNWYINHPKPVIYDQMPQPGPPYDLRLIWRPEEPLMHPPKGAVVVRQNNSTPLRELVDYDITTSTYSVTSEPIQLRYHVPYIMYRDYADYKNQLFYYTTPGNDGAVPELPPDLVDYLESEFVYPFEGDYEIKLQYFLPGAEAANSEVSYLLPYDIFQDNDDD